VCQNKNGYVPARDYSYYKACAWMSSLTPGKGERGLPAGSRLLSCLLAWGQGGHRLTQTAGCRFGGWVSDILTLTYQDEGMVQRSVFIA
jgi:hypothetical protein